MAETKDKLKKYKVVRAKRVYDYREKEYVQPGGTLMLTDAEGEAMVNIVALASSTRPVVGGGISAEKVAATVETAVAQREQEIAEETQARLTKELDEAFPHHKELAGAGFTTVGSISYIGEDVLKNIEGIGDAGVKKIRAALKAA